MRVLSWNINCLKGSSRVVAIVDAIARHSPDVVALQEVSADGNFVASIRLELGRRGLVGFHFGEPHPAARKRYGDVVKRYGNVVASTGSAAASIDAMPVSDGDLPWWHLITSAEVTTSEGVRFEMFSVHIPNGSGNGWAKIDAFRRLAAVLQARPVLPRIVAGDFNEPWRFNGEAVESFACKDGVALDVPWTRDGKHVKSESRPRREWQEAVSDVLRPDSSLGVRRILPRHGVTARASHITRGGKERLFDHILASQHFRCSGVEYDDSVRAAASNRRLSDHSIVFADVTLNA